MCRYPVYNGNFDDQSCQGCSATSTGRFSMQSSLDPPSCTQISIRNNGVTIISYDVRLRLGEPSIFSSSSRAGCPERPPHPGTTNQNDTQCMPNPTYRHKKNNKIQKIANFPSHGPFGRKVFVYAQRPVERQPERDVLVNPMSSGLSESRQGCSPTTYVILYPKPKMLKIKSTSASASIKE